MNRKDTCAQCASFHNQLRLLSELTKEASAFPTYGTYPSVVGGFMTTMNFVGEFAKQTRSKVLNSLAGHLLSHEELPE